jgi:hypothetical protein
MIKRKQKRLDTKRVTRIVNLYATAFNSATPSEYLQGVSWYSDARNELRLIAQKHGVSLDIACAICAALSPRLRWAQNVLYTDWVLQGLPVPHLGAMVAKAYAIKESGNTGLITAPKTSAFFNNLLGNESEYVTIDMWMYRLAGIDNDKAKPSDYRYCEQAIRELNKRFVELTPAQLQAVLWVVARNR